MTTINENTFKSLIATTLREKEDGYILSEMFTRYPSIQELLDVTEEELLNIKGIGKTKAKQIIAALQLARMNPVTTEQRFKIRSPQDAYTYLQDLQHLQQEHFVILGLNTKNEVMFRKTIFIGSLNASICHPREIKKEFTKFKETLVTNNGSILDLSEENTEADNTDLQWFKKNINAQALPNGYCRLPVIAGPCPHANACLDCTNFCTSKQFLTEHEEHLERTKEILNRAKQNQWQRQVETNERVKNRLEQIIHSLKETN